MKKRQIFFCCIIILLSLLIISCDDETLTVPACLQSPSVDFQTHKLRVITDSVFDYVLKVDNTGLVTCGGIKLYQNGISRLDSVSGYINPCLQFELQVFRTDSADNSKMKIDGEVNYTVDSGGIFYCSNINNNCNYEKVGYFAVTYQYNEWSGSFYSPLFNGYFFVY